MKKDVDDFICEYIENFSDLFIETFIIRFENEFDKRYTIENLCKANKMLNEIIEEKIKKIK